MSFEINVSWRRPGYRSRSCDLATSGRIALNTVVCVGARMVGVGDVDSPAFESACRTVASHQPMPLRWIGTVRGHTENQRSSAWISGWLGFRAVRSDAWSRLAAWARFSAVASGLSVGTINAWLQCMVALGHRLASAVRRRQRWPERLAGGWRLACLNPETPR